ncbi:MAG: 50S ribosomal protein L18 [Parcubacteria group bacterium CG23_combo_of_CG06-09_8_20_14_all_35_9]|nr:MAG: 50S ribosomal protein L18 [Parcubacteria group bacterium CG23_combo_of_CG06-09_8_20_14_all_35_9]
MYERIKQQKRKRRARRVRIKIKGIKEHPRLSVFRSNKYIYAQLINDAKGETLLSVSQKEVLIKEKKKSKKDNLLFKGKIGIAYEVGLVLAQKAIKKGIKKIIFDRGRYKYHGRIKAVAQGAREGGLKF